jgi:hypothetical protein
MDFEANRNLCLQQQSALRLLLEQPQPPEEALPRFLEQHARLHSRLAFSETPWSYEDEIFAGLGDAQARRIPPHREHSIAWVFWHLARIEDTAMNMLVAGEEQVFNQGWQTRLKVGWSDSGNVMEGADISELSQNIDIPTLRDYRAAVGRRTRQIVLNLQPQDLPHKVDPARVRRVMESGALLEAARPIAVYWSRRTIAGLLLMPASRHLLVHLNEAMELKVIT